jgi:hypothetical protein
MVVSQAVKMAGDTMVLYDIIYQFQRLGQFTAARRFVAVSATDVLM